MMFNNDLVITSPGMSMFEAIFVGTPVLSICPKFTAKTML